MNVRLPGAMPRAELSRAFSPQKSPKQNRPGIFQGSMAAPFNAFGFASAFKSSTC
jgi:hypothetical protein